MERFAGHNIRSINFYRVLRISADKAQEQRPTQNGRGSQGLYEYDSILLQDNMAEMFKDGFIDRMQNSIHASEIQNFVLEPCIASNCISLDPAFI
jgi:hypothetical protein